MNEALYLSVTYPNGNVMWGKSFCFKKGYYTNCTVRGPPQGHNLDSQQSFLTQPKDSHQDHKHLTRPYAEHTQLHIFTIYFSKIHFNIIPPYVLPNGLFQFLQPQFCYRSLATPSMHHVPPSFNKHTTVALLNHKTPSNYRNTTKLLTLMIRLCWHQKHRASKINCNIAADGIFTWSTCNMSNLCLGIFKYHQLILLQHKRLIISQCSI